MNNIFKDIKDGKKVFKHHAVPGKCTVVYYYYYYHITTIL